MSHSNREVRFPSVEERFYDVIGQRVQNNVDTIECSVSAAVRTEEFLKLLRMRSISFSWMPAAVQRPDWGGRGLSSCFQPPSSDVPTNRPNVLPLYSWLPQSNRLTVKRDQTDPIALYSAKSKLAGDPWRSSVASASGPMLRQSEQVPGFGNISYTHAVSEPT
jgi:hypothetical protein